MNRPPPGWACGLQVFAWLIVIPRTVAAFDYLEHSYFADRGCLAAQRALAATLETLPEGPERESLTARYLALAVVCPRRWDRPYCLDGYKQLSGTLNSLDAPPWRGHDHSITLGDLAALPDHLSEFGAIRGVPRAAQTGLLSEVLAWLGPESGDPGGIIADVAEDGCETDGRVDWARVQIDAAEAFAQGGAAPKNLPRRALSPAARAPLNQGPFDSAGLYSFDNPHYLDLVLTNHHHFSPLAYRSWLGFHAMAVDMADRPCSVLLALDEDRLEALSEGWAHFEAVDWDDLPGAFRRARGCQLIADRIHQRLTTWSAHAEIALVRPVAARIETMTETDPLLAATTSALMGLVLEGSGLHFLHDGFAGGHLTVDRAGYSLGAARHLHDAGNRNGAVASLGTADRLQAFVAFGDGYLLGRAPAPDVRCRWETMGEQTRDVVSTCLLRLQRTLLLRATAASLVDWSLGGVLNDSPQADLPGVEALVAMVRGALPTRPVAHGEPATVLAAPQRLSSGDLPEPPPAFSYQSLGVTLALDAAGNATQTGVRLIFLSELDDMANWMTSYHLSLLSTRRQTGDEMLGELGYLFHWRWGARWLVSAGSFGYFGLRGFGREVESYAGLGPHVGTSVLPEGWIKLPLELGVSFRTPLTLLDSARRPAVEAWWIELAVGLAFL